MTFRATPAISPPASTGSRLRNETVFLAHNGRDVLNEPAHPVELVQQEIDRLACVFR